jgi:NADPH:quinone reductase-like Zn-dependent oxidoreductase
MKALVYHNYGSSDVLKCENLERPTARDDEVLIRVCAASVNPLDWHFMRGAPYIVRTQTGLRKPKDKRLGVDLAGKVEAVTRAVGLTRLRSIGFHVVGVADGGIVPWRLLFRKIRFLTIANSQ